MQSKIEQQVMASVAVIYTTRRLTSRTALKLYVLAASIIGSVFFISLPHVWANLMDVSRQGLPGITTFMVVAVLKTQWMVQLALVVAAIVILSLVVDLFRTRTSSFASV